MFYRAGFLNICKFYLLVMFLLTSTFFRSLQGFCTTSIYDGKYYVCIQIYPIRDLIACTLGIQDNLQALYIILVIYRIGQFVFKKRHWEECVGTICTLRVKTSTPWQYNAPKTNRHVTQRILLITQKPCLFIRTIQNCSSCNCTYKYRHYAC